MLKIPVLQEMEQMKAELGGHVALFSFRLSNLCVKAEPMALLPVNIPTEAGVKKFEEVCKAGLIDDFTFGVICEPKMIPVVQYSITEVHPEFIQEIKKFDENDDDSRYISLKMPPVNKDRHDIMTDGVNALYSITKTQMEACFTKHSGKIAIKTVSQSKEDQDMAKEMLQKIYDDHVALRDEDKDKKLAEIDEAYAKYQEEQAANSDSDLSKAAEIGQQAGKSMKLE